MSIAPIGQTAFSGIQRGTQGVRRAAAQVAQQVVQPAPSGDFARSMLEMKQHAIQAKASTRALKAYNDTLGTLLDIKA
jgi:hypothetical protein